MQEYDAARITHDEAQIGAVRLHYAKAGDGGKLVVLLHGFPEFWYSWRFQLADLSDEYTVVAPDLRGFNLSDKPRDVAGYSIDEVSLDVTGLINHLGFERAAVIGHDWGAAVAWSLAKRHPEYLWKVGALQVPPVEIWRKNLTLKQFLASWYMWFFQIPALPEYLLALNDFAPLADSLRKTAAVPEVFSKDVIAEYKKAWREPNALTAMLNYYRANFFSRFKSSAENEIKIKVPTLFIYGEQDKAVLRSTVRNIGQMIDAPFEEFFIPNAGHWVQQEASETVTQIIREFLAG